MITVRKIDVDSELHFILRICIGNEVLQNIL